MNRLTINHKKEYEELKKNHYDFYHNWIVFGSGISDDDAIEVIKDISKGVEACFEFYHDFDSIDTVHSRNKSLLEKTEDLDCADYIYLPTLGTDSLGGSVAYYSVSHFKSVNEFIQHFANDIEKRDLSNFEKIMAAYNVVTKLSSYHDSDIIDDPRNVYGVFDTGDIVCEGYVAVFNRLLESVGITASKMEVYLKSPHAQSFVSIDDDKYNIHGNYVFDPTGDSIRYFEFKKKLAQSQTDEYGLNDRAPLFISIRFFAMCSGDPAIGKSHDSSFIWDVSSEAISDRKVIQCMYEINKQIFNQSVSSDDMCPVFSLALGDRKHRLGDFNAQEIKSMVREEVNCLERQTNDLENFFDKSDDVDTKDSLSTLKK